MIIRKEIQSINKSSINKSMKDFQMRSPLVFIVCIYVDTLYSIMRQKR